MGKATLLARKAVLDQVLEEARLEVLDLRTQEADIVIQLGSHAPPDSDVPTPELLLQWAAAGLHPQALATGMLQGHYSPRCGVVLHAS